MSYQIQYTKRLKQDVKRMIKRGKNKMKLQSVMENIIEGKRLEAKFKLHKLVGNYKDRYECHIEPDWILIFKREQNTITFERTGSHGDLFA